VGSIGGLSGVAVWHSLAWWCLPKCSTVKGRASMWMCPVSSAIMGVVLGRKHPLHADRAVHRADGVGLRLLSMLMLSLRPASQALVCGVCIAPKR